MMWMHLLWLFRLEPCAVGEIYIMEEIDALFFGLLLFLAKSRSDVVCVRRGADWRCQTTARCLGFRGSQSVEALIGF